MRSSGAVVAAACWFALVAPGCKPRQGDPPRGGSPAPAPVVDRAAVLATVPDADRAPANREYLFAERGGGVAWAAEEGARVRVFHGARAGPAYDGVGRIAVSLDGRRFAHGALRDGRWRMVVDGREGEPFDAVESPVFSPDGLHVAYEARRGEAWHLVIDGKPNAGAVRARYLIHEFSADSARVVFLEAPDDSEWGRLVVSELASGRQTIVEGRASLPILNADHSRVAAIGAREGGQRVVTFALDATPRAEGRGATYGAVHKLAFGPDGVAIAYHAERGGESYVGVDDREERLRPGDDMVEVPVVRPDRGVAALVLSDGAVRLRQYFVERWQEEGAYQGARGLVFAREGGGHAYVAERGQTGFVVANGREGPAFDRVVSPMISPDGTRVVYRARKDGKRFVVVADAEGRTLRQHPAYDQVHPVRFTADGRSVAYGVKDGSRLAWKVEPL